MLLVSGQPPCQHLLLLLTAVNINSNYSMHADAGSVETLLPEIWMKIFSYLTKVRFPVICDLGINH